MTRSEAAGPSGATGATDDDPGRFSSPRRRALSNNRGVVVRPEPGRQVLGSAVNDRNAPLARLPQDGGRPLNDAGGPNGVRQRPQPRLRTDHSVLELLHEHGAPVRCHQFGERGSAAHGSVGAIEERRRNPDGGRTVASRGAGAIRNTRCDR